MPVANVKHTTGQKDARDFEAEIQTQIDDLQTAWDAINAAGWDGLTANQRKQGMLLIFMALIKITKGIRWILRRVE